MSGRAEKNGFGVGGREGGRGRQIGLGQVTRLPAP